VRPFGGRPLIAYSIALARSVSGIDRCLVSTDDPEIAAIARRWGAELIDRPAELATDTATTASVARHALERAAASGAAPRTLVTLQPTNPLRTVEMVEEGLALFLGRRPDSVVSVAPVTSKTGSVRNGFYLPDYVPGTRSQDLAERVHETGQLYVSDAALVLERGELFGTRMLALRTDPRFASADIDTAEDFELAESLYARYRHLFPYMESASLNAALADIAHA
jgi:N-acylneuraminate cytidylyltransferase